MSARCVRPDCDLPAAARLSARFGERVGWLCDIDGSEVSPHDYLLCARHADSLTLPRNWEMHDERSRRIASFPTPPRETAPEHHTTSGTAYAPEHHTTSEAHTEVPSPASPTEAEPVTRPAEELDDPIPKAAPQREPRDEPAAVPAAHVEPDRYDPADEVDESTPLLSRAFRAALPGHGDRG